MMKHIICGAHDLLNLTMTLPKDVQNHSIRVGRYTKIIWKLLLGKELAAEAGFAAICHDIGKAYISKTAIKQTNRNNVDQARLIEQHIRYADIILKKGKTVFYGNSLITPKLQEMIREMAYFHHEYWDGTGYVEGRRGKAIPITARICAVANIYDILSSGMYGSSVIRETDVWNELQKQAGLKFDPEIIEVLIENKLKL